MKKQKVREIILGIDDLKAIEKRLTDYHGLDSLDIVELLMFIEDLKNVNIDI